MSSETLSLSPPPALFPTNQRDRLTVVFAGGGTGGHLFPAMAVADALKESNPDIKIVFFGSERQIDRQIVEGAGWSLIRQPVRPFRSAPWSWPGYVRSWRQSRRMCREHFDRILPAIVLGSGGFACVPAIQEAHRRGVTTAMFNPDVVPGRATHYLLRKVDRMFVQWAASIPYLTQHKHVQVTGCPVRRAFLEVGREAGVRHFGLDPRKKTLLVTGASQGARSVNEALLAALDEIEKEIDWQILHLSGSLDFERVERAYSTRSVRGQVLAFTDHMAEALAASDLVVSRAGASSLAEIAAVGRASILMPYPFHRDQHQWANARVLSDVGAAMIVADRAQPERTLPEFLDVTLKLMRDDDKRERMASAAGSLGSDDAAKVIAQSLLEMVSRK